MMHSKLATKVRDARSARREPHRPLRAAFCLLPLLLSCFAREASGAAQEIVPVEGQAFSGELISIEPDGRVTFLVATKSGANGKAAAPPGGEPAARTLQWDEIVRWGNPTAARAQILVVLADGGQLVAAADWAGGAAVRLEGDDVVVLSDVFDEVRLPRSHVKGIVFAQRRHVAEREALTERVRGEHSARSGLPERGSNDAVLLTNGDRLTGKLAAFEGGSLTVESAGGAAKLPLSHVEAVVLGNRQRPATAGGRARAIVGLRDGSVFYVRDVRADAKEIVLTLTGGKTISGGAADDIAALQPVGGRIVYLSDLEGDYRHVPYFDVSWPLERDRNVSGEALTVRGKRYWKGIGMHSAGRLTYSLDGTYGRFDASVALDDAAEGRGSVTFGAYVLRNGEWKEAYKSAVIRGGAEPQAVSVDVEGAQGLTLTIDYADRGDELDRADWLDARLVKSGM